jgi:drug/metabolite transporter (DMT)-like permease
MTKFRTFGAVILSMIFWSFSFIWFKVANEYYRPLAIVFVRLIISTVFLTTYLLLTRKFMKIRKEDRRFFFMLAMFEPFLYFIGESFGLTYVSATVGSVIISTIPVVATVGAWLFLRERLRLVNYAGILLSFIGIIVFILRKDGSLSFNIKGLALLSFAVVSAVGYNLTLSRLVDHYTPVYIVNVQNVLGSLFFLPIFLIFDLKPFIAAPHTIESLKPIIELSAFASCGAFILYAYAVRNLGITRANVFTNCIPIFTAFFSFLLIGEKLTLQNMAGMGIVVAGLFLSQLHTNNKKIDEALVLTGKTA